MRTSLFVSTLFAVSLVGGLALAEKPDGHVSFHREHGDMVEKSYRHDARAVSNATGGVERNAGSTKNPISNAGQSRVNCSTDSADCAASHGRASAARDSGKTTADLAKPASAKGATDKFDQRSDARTSCNEGDQCSVSSKAAKQLWQNHGAEAAAAVQSGQTASTSLPGAAARLVQQRTEPRMAQGDSAGGEDSSVPSKSNKQFWAYESVKAGTFHGAVDTTGAGATEKNAERAIKAMKAEKSKQQ